MKCLFCDIIAGDQPAHFVHEDDNHVAFLDKYPIDVGHTLVVPKIHHEKITDMNSNKVGMLFSQVPRIATGILKATGADAFSLGQNNGRAAKQIIPHVHIHIIPRFNNKGTIWTKRGISTDTELRELAQKIQNCLKDN
ncbi:MAG: HIT family protein [Nitrosopumilaceae archaeon]